MSWMVVFAILCSISLYVLVGSMMSVIVFLPQYADFSTLINRDGFYS